MYIIHTGDEKFASGDHISSAGHQKATRGFFSSPARVYSKLAETHTEGLLPKILYRCVPRKGTPDLK